MGKGEACDVFYHQSVIVCGIVSLFSPWCDRFLAIGYKQASSGMRFFRQLLNCLPRGTQIGSSGDLPKSVEKMEEGLGEERGEGVGMGGGGGMGGWICLVDEVSIVRPSQNFSVFCLIMEFSCMILKLSCLVMKFSF